MDTDSLSEMAYEIIKHAYLILDSLGLTIAASCVKYKKEDEFLLKTKNLLEDLKESPEFFLETWDPSGQLEVSVFKFRLTELIGYVDQVVNTSIEERGDGLH